MTLIIFRESVPNSENNEILCFEKKMQELKKKTEQTEREHILLAVLSEPCNLYLCTTYL